ncbi:hypothetical protein DsansV1_C08g0084511 [Dioscorea sansibarensis]
MPPLSSSHTTDLVTARKYQGSEFQKNPSFSLSWILSSALGEWDALLEVGERTQRWC